MTWKSFLETLRQANSPKGTITPDPRVLARVLRFVPKELSLQYEVRSLVYVDDDSQILYDRWTYQEFWAWVPGRGSHYTTVDGNREIPITDVSNLRLEYAFARAVPAVSNNVQLSSLILAKNVVAASLRDGIRASDRIIDRLIDSEMMRSDILLPEEAIHTIPLASGFTLMFDPLNSCGGAVTVRWKRDGWIVSIVKEMVSALLPDWGKYGPLISAELTDATATASTLRLTLNAERIGQDTILGINHWIEKGQSSPHTEGDGTREYDVALSFASEDRSIAEEVATCLVLNGFKVFYYEFETAQIWGQDLHEHLASIYQNRASYCVVFISESYLRKYWTKYELQKILSRAQVDMGGHILPVYLDATQVPDIESSIAGVSYDRLGAVGLVELIAEKVRRTG